MKKYKSDIWSSDIYSVWSYLKIHFEKYVAQTGPDGKVVLCTGGAGTICSVQVGAMVQLGANAAIIGRREDITKARANELQALRRGSQVIGIAADVRDFKSMQAAIDLTTVKLGRIDFVMKLPCDMGKFVTNAFNSVIDIDVLGSYNTVKAAIDELKKTRGRILFTGTIYQAHVSAAKAAIDALSQVLAVELGPHGITSNGLARLSRKDQDDTVCKNIPLQRLDDPFEIADATIFLFSHGSNYITGETIVVDGDYWHRSSAASGNPYPEYVLEDRVVEGVKGMKAKL
ncbi:hypothetical protein EDC01DRAFT_719706 [Geopyxis carbonaria]|nr:hypothetical protein EDC01DRAFT_719706 [Geopyxis carbonaria]